MQVSERVKVRLRRMSLETTRDLLRRLDRRLQRIAERLQRQSSHPIGLVDVMLAAVKTVESARAVYESMRIKEHLFSFEERLHDVVQRKPVIQVRDSVPTIGRPKVLWKGLAANRAVCIAEEVQDYAAAMEKKVADLQKQVDTLMSERHGQFIQGILGVPFSRSMP